MKTRMMGMLVLVVGLAAGAAQAASFTVNTVSGVDGGAQVAKAIFTFTSTDATHGTLDITLTNEVAVISKVSSFLTGLDFEIDNLASLTYNGITNAPALLNITGGVVTSAGTAGAFDWKPTVKAALTAETPFRPYEIVNNPATFQFNEHNPNSGIGTSTHSPVIVGPVIFGFDYVTDGTGAPQLHDVSFLFGTEGERQHTEVPIPGAALLLGSGLAGLGVFGRRKK